MTKPSAVCGAKNVNYKGVLLLMSPKAAMVWGCEEWLSLLTALSLKNSQKFRRDVFSLARLM